MRKKIEGGNSPERIKQINQIWRDANKEYIEEYQAEYRKRNRHRMREYAREAYHRNKHKKQLKPITPEEVAAKMESDRLYREEQMLKEII